MVLDIAIRRAVISNPSWKALPPCETKNAVAPSCPPIIPTLWMPIKRIISCIKTKIWLVIATIFKVLIDNHSIQSNC